MSDKMKKNPFRGLVNYFKDVRAELKKVVWPTRKQIQNNTAIVIVCLLFVGAIIWVLDLGFGATLGVAVDYAQGKARTQIQQDAGEGIDINSVIPEDGAQGGEAQDGEVQDQIQAQDGEGEAPADGEAPSGDQAADEQ